MKTTATATKLEGFFNLVEKRRAIRKYKQDNIPDEDIRRMLNAARLAPSANNSQPWTFIVVKDQKTKELLSRPSSQSFIVDANVIMVVLGDPSVSCCPAATWTTRDPIIATDHLVLAATALGYGTCWIATYESRPKEWIEEVKKVLKIPKHLHIIVLVAIGVPDENPPPRPRKNLQEISFSEEYGNSI
ncbi:MAG: nitroreductase family protein [Candidatus Heimdallarchaeota archaeon]|nr:MAG: nitroreductase family protein [Candidatus Heimdallarchaeota archaeon]